MTEEVWIPVVSSENYFVSNLGRVRTTEKTINGRTWPARVLKPFRRGTKGYVGVEINGKCQSVHRLVACAFLGKPTGDFFVNHKNGIKNDNRVENLEWVTAGENLKHSYQVLGRVSRGPNFGKRGAEFHGSRKVVAKSCSTGVELFFDSFRDAAREIGIHESGVSHAIRGRIKSSGGWVFALVDEAGA